MTKWPHSANDRSEERAYAERKDQQMEELQRLFFFAVPLGRGTNDRNFENAALKPQSRSLHHVRRHSPSCP